MSAKNWLPDATLPAAPSARPRAARWACGLRFAALGAPRRPHAGGLSLHAAALVVVAGALTASPQTASAAAATSDGRLVPLERVEHVSVLVDDMTPDAETLALTREIIQADAEDQLKRSGLRVRGEGATPALYFQISVLCDDTDPCAIDVSSAAIQDVFLEAMATAPIRAKTWYTGQIILAPRSSVAASVRNAVRGQADEFAADVLAARRRNPAPAPAIIEPPTAPEPASWPARSAR
jgi:hypothetical protein